MADLPSEITECLKCVLGRPAKAEELIREITMMASLNAAWPTATYEQWEAAIETAVKSGLLVRTDQKLWLAPPKFEEPKPVQKGLFDEC